MSTLIAAHSYGLNVFLNRCGNYLQDGPVVSQMNDFSPRSLKNPPHYVNRSIMAVEQRRRCNDSDMVYGLIRFERQLHGDPHDYVDLVQLFTQESRGRVYI